MSDNVRVYEIAEEAGASSSEVIAKAKDLGIELKSPQTAVSFESEYKFTSTHKLELLIIPIFFWLDL